MECLCRLYQSFIVLVQSNLSGGKLFQCRCVGQQMILKICLLYKGILWTLEVSYAHNKYLQRTLIKIPAFCVILSCLNLLLNIGDIFGGDKSFFCCCPMCAIENWYEIKNNMSWNSNVDQKVRITYSQNSNTILK